MQMEEQHFTIKTKPENAAQRPDRQSAADGNRKTGTKKHTSAQKKKPASKKKAAAAGKHSDFRDSVRKAAEAIHQKNQETKKAAKRLASGSKSSGKSSAKHRTASGKTQNGRRRSAFADQILTSLKGYFNQTRSNVSKRVSTAVRHSKKEIRQFRTLMFAVFAVIYIIILALIIHSYSKKAHTYLGEYEASRPQYLIEEYVASLDDTFLNDMIKQAAGGVALSQYESSDVLLNTMNAKISGGSNYSYQKTADSTESRPNYYILRNEQAIATVALNRAGWTEKYSFPVWSMGDPVSVLQLQAAPAYSVSIRTPQGAAVKVNGVDVPPESFIEAPSELQLTATEMFYMNQPVSQQCEISGLYQVPVIEVTDAEGRILTPEKEPDPNAASQAILYPQADEAEPDAALLQYVDGLTHAYMDYVINTRCDIDNNLAVLNNYLLPGSTLATLMQTIYSDVWYNNDPNMREDHVYEVRHVRKYADNLCTVDVHLESTIGKVAVNDYIGTVRWVLVNNGYGWRASNFELFPN